MNYPAKIVLFGEYGIILGSMALAIPYPRLSGGFRFPENSTTPHLKTQSESNIEIIKLLSFFKKDLNKFQFLDLQCLDHDVNKGMYFDSSIPVGSGLGSSGALTAALYDRYASPENQTDYQTIKLKLSLIESYFHGLSSGIDPLVSLLKNPVLIGSNTSFITTVALTLFSKIYTLFLINTHSMGKTDLLVSSFLKQYKQPDFRRIIDQEYIPLINSTIEAIQNADFGHFDQLMINYSLFQFTYFKEMIPLEMRASFDQGIKSGDFTLKLCGSGGGGFILGFARDRTKAESYFKLNHLDFTIV
jgi:mevalonate kinase